MRWVREVMALAQEHRIEQQCQKFLDSALEHHLKEPQKPYCFDFNDIDLATELAILEGDFMKALRRLHRAYEILVSDTSREWDEEGVVLSELKKQVAPLRHSPHLPLKLKVKMGVLLILVNFTDLGTDFLQCLFALPIENLGDTYYEVASILAINGHHEAALEVLGELEARAPEVSSL